MEGRCVVASTRLRLRVSIKKTATPWCFFPTLPPPRCPCPLLSYGRLQQFHNRMVAQFPPSHSLSLHPLAAEFSIRTIPVNSHENSRMPKPQARASIRTFSESRHIARRTIAQLLSYSGKKTTIAQVQKRKRKI